MPTFLLNKLVKDSVYESMLALGEKPEIRILDNEDFEKELLRKLEEERAELAKTDDKAKERKDIELVEEQLKLHKSGKKGGVFEKRVFVGKLLIENPKDKWIAYYRREPDRFPEID